MHIGVHLPEDLPCSSSGQQTKTQVMCSNQAIVSVVTTTNSSLFIKHQNCWVELCWRAHSSSSSSPMYLSVHHGGTASTRAQLKRGLLFEDLWISADAHPHEAFVFTAKSDPRTKNQLRSQCGKWSSIGPTTKHTYRTPFRTHSSFSGGWKKNGPFLMSQPRPAKHLETILTPDN